MEFFYTTQTVDVDVCKGTPEQHKILIHPVDQKTLSSGQIPNNLIYVSTLGCVYNIQSTLESAKVNFDLACFSESTKKKVCSLPEFPISLSNFDITALRELSADRTPIKNSPFISLKDRLQPLIDKNQKSIKVAILNGIGTGIGDSVIGIRAIQLFHIELKKHFQDVVIDLYQTPFNANMNKRKLYDQEKIVNSNRVLPLTLETLLQYDCTADFSSMVIRENFDTMPMIDFFLENLSIDPKTITNEAKRNFIKISEKVKNDEEIKFIALKQSGKHLLMIHPVASVGSRTMPKDVLQKIVKEVLDKTDYTIILTNSPPDFIKELQSKRVFDFTAASSDIDSFNYVISQVDSIITVDTCTYHIADSFNKPTVAIFTTIDPKLRVTYYPTVTPIVLKANNKLWGVHGTMDPDDLLYIQTLWKNLQPETVLKSLHDIIKYTKENTKTIECPVCLGTNNYVPTDKYMSYDLITCTKCESEYTNPRIPDDYDKMYAEDYLHYLKELPRNESVYGYMSQWRFESVRKYLDGLPKTGTLLDVGCANGFMVGYTEDLGFDSYGIDTSQVVIDFAETHINLKGKVFVSDDLSKLPKQMPQQYDIITSFELVEHLPDPRAFAKQVHDRLKPGGIWIFSTPNRNRIQFAMGVKNTSRHRGLDGGDYPAEHLTRFRPLSHQILAKNSGFEVVYQNTTRIGSHSIADAYGLFPKVSVTDTEGKTIELDQVNLNNAIYNYFQNMTNSIQGYGHFLVTFCRKPL